MDEGGIGEDSNLYVSKLPLNFNEYQLMDFFSPFGEVLSVRILRDASRPDTCGLVKFGDRAAAERALSSIHGSCVFDPGNPIQVKFALKSGPSGNRSPLANGPIRNRTSPNNRYNPMVGGGGGGGGGRLAPDVDSGPVPNPTPDMVEKCFHPTHGWGLYVCNLDAEDSDVTLYRLFAPFGPITSVRAMLDMTSNKCRGYGFVNMAKYDSAYEAVRLLHGLELATGRVLNVSFKAQKRSEFR